MMEKCLSRSPNLDSGLQKAALFNPWANFGFYDSSRLSARACDVFCGDVICLPVARDVAPQEENIYETASK